jgi:hypothetical protein
MLAGDRRLPAGYAVSGEVQYYVIVAGNGSRAATGLARRTFTDTGPADETLRRDLSWREDSAIVEWEYGDLDADLIKISEQEAENLTQAFRLRLGRLG